MGAKHYPPPNELRRIFNYHEDGYLVKRSGKYSGKKVGFLTSQGYLAVNYEKLKKRFLAHRLIYIWHNGVIPTNMDIDHIDGDKTNNKIDNLRLATRSENQLNRTNPKGYSYRKSQNKYHARVTVDGKMEYLGQYKKPEDAHKVYMEYKIKHGLIPT